ncbi:MAG: TetR/AcrR family transcriptional regulator [Sneathiella sp.]
MTSEKRTTYRHGNVRDAAIKASLTLVNTESADKLSMRRVAEALGVAHRALYNHFSDREALLDAIATEGFHALAGAVANTTNQLTFVSAYLTFALEHPHLYPLMMSRPHATMSETPPLQKAVHQVITKAMAFFGQENATPQENRRAVMKVTILLHGGIMLRTNGILDVDGDGHFIDELTKMVAVP